MKKKKKLISGDLIVPGRNLKQTIKHRSNGINFKMSFPIKKSYKTNMTLTKQIRQNEYLHLLFVNKTNFYKYIPYVEEHGKKKNTEHDEERD